MYNLKTVLQPENNERFRAKLLEVSGIDDDLVTIDEVMYYVNDYPELIEDMDYTQRERITLYQYFGGLNEEELRELTERLGLYESSGDLNTSEYEVNHIEENDFEVTFMTEDGEEVILILTYNNIDDYDVAQVLYEDGEGSEDDFEQEIVEAKIAVKNYIMANNWKPFEGDFEDSDTGNINEWYNITTTDDDWEDIGVGTGNIHISLDDEYSCWLSVDTEDEPVDGKILINLSLENIDEELAYDNYLVYNLLDMTITENVTDVPEIVFDVFKYALRRGFDEIINEVFDITNIETEGESFYNIEKVSTDTGELFVYGESAGQFFMVPQEDRDGEFQVNFDDELFEFINNGNEKFENICWEWAEENLDIEGDYETEGGYKDLNFDDWTGELNTIFAIDSIPGYVYELVDETTVNILDLSTEEWSRYGIKAGGEIIHIDGDELYGTAVNGVFKIYVKYKSLINADDYDSDILEEGDYETVNDLIYEFDELTSAEWIIVNVYDDEGNDKWEFNVESRELTQIQFDCITPYTEESVKSYIHKYLENYMDINGYDKIKFEDWDGANNTSQWHEALIEIDSIDDYLFEMYDMVTVNIANIRTGKYSQYEVSEDGELTLSGFRTEITDPNVLRGILMMYNKYHTLTDNKYRPTIDINAIYPGYGTEEVEDMSTNTDELETIVLDYIGDLENYRSKVESLSVGSGVIFKISDYKLWLNIESDDEDVYNETYISGHIEYPNGDSTEFKVTDSEGIYIYGYEHFDEYPNSVGIFNDFTDFCESISIDYNDVDSNILEEGDDFPIGDLTAVFEDVTEPGSEPTLEITISNDEGESVVILFTQSGEDEETLSADFDMVEYFVEDDSAQYDWQAYKQSLHEYFDANYGEDYFDEENGYNY